MPDIMIISIFPLPNVVLFPKTYLPLHIFEPRYRQMVKDALNGNRFIGMVLLQEGWEKDYYGNPPIFYTGCIGKMTEVNPLEDGRYNIMLYGLSKFHIKKEIFDKSYRQAQVEFHRDNSQKEIILETDIRNKLLSALNQLTKHVGDQGNIRKIMDTMDDDVTLINTFSHALDFTPLEKQYLLESDLLSEQCKRLIDLIQFQLHNKPAWVSPILGQHRKN